MTGIEGDRMVAGTSSVTTGQLPQQGIAHAPLPAPRTRWGGALGTGDDSGTSFRPVAQTPEELRRECLGTIAGAAKDIERCAMDGKTDALKVQFEFLKVQMRRLDTIMGTVRQKTRTM